MARSGLLTFVSSPARWLACSLERVLASVSSSEVSHWKTSANSAKRAIVGTTPRSIRETASLPIPNRSATCS